MKKKIHIELLATSVLAILLTLMFAIFVFYGQYREQIIGDLKADAWVMRNLHVFEDSGALKAEVYDLGPDSLRVTLVGQEGAVIFDSNVDASVMANHEDRPEIREAMETGEGIDIRRSETLDKNLFYYAVQLENGTVLRISREADSLFAVFQNMLPTLFGVSAVLFLFCILLSQWFTRSLIAPIEEMA